MRWTRVWVFLLMGAAGAQWLSQDALGSTASRLYRKAVKAERAGQTAQAYLFYSQAAAANPKKTMYREQAEALAPLAAIQANVKLPAADADSPESPFVDLRPEAVFDSITARELAATQQLLPPQRLELKPGLRSFDFNGDFKSLFEQMGAQLGLQIVFDGDFQNGHTLRFRLQDVDEREALHALEASTGSFVVPLGPRLIMVAKDTEARRKDLEQTETATVPMPNLLTIQELTEIGQAVKQSVNIDKVYWDAQANQIILRDRVSRVQAAQAVLQDLLAYRGEVAIDLQFIELNETDMLDIGADLQTSFPISFLGGKGGIITLAQLAKFSAGQLFGVGISNIDVIAQMNRATTKTLLKTTLVSVEGQKATFHAGSKYPIVTSQFVGAVNTGGQVFQPTPSFTFEDLGIVVTITPHIHGNEEVSLDLDTEFKVLGAYQQVGLPIISSRKMQSTLRLKKDEWALVAGLTRESTSKVRSGPALFSNIPFLGNLVSRFTRNRAKDYVILSVKPRILKLPPDQIVTRRVYVGSETRSVTPL